MKILITDDHQIVRDGLKELLKQIPDLESIEEAKDGQETMAKIANTSFDIILLDISLPDTTGLEVLKYIMNKRPEQKVLMLSMHPQEQYAIRSLKTGASGYLTKDTASEELKEAIGKIVSGGKYISASLADNIAKHLDKDFSQPIHELLSEREFEVMIRIAKGKSLQEIGDELFISGKTVSTYRSRIMEKMEIKNNSDITHYCIKNELE